MYIVLLGNILLNEVKNNLVLPITQDEATRLIFRVSNVYNLSDYRVIKYKPVTLTKR